MYKSLEKLNFFVGFKNFLFGYLINHWCISICLTNGQAFVGPRKVKEFYDKQLENLRVFLLKNPGNVTPKFSNNTALTVSSVLELLHIGGTKQAFESEDLNH